MAIVVNLSTASLGIFGQSCDSFIQICSDLAINEGHINCIIGELSNTIIRTIFLRNTCKLGQSSTKPLSVERSVFGFLVYASYVEMKFK